MPPRQVGPLESFSGPLGSFRGSLEWFSGPLESFSGGLESFRCLLVGVNTPRESPAYGAHLGNSVAPIPEIDAAGEGAPMFEKVVGSRKAVKVLVATVLCLSFRSESRQQGKEG